MRYLVVTSGRVTLPERVEGQALTVLEVELAAKEGPFDPDGLTAEGRPIETLGDLAAFVGVTAVREGDSVLFSTDHQGEPRWTEQAQAFWTGLGRFATGGEIHLRGADGATWSYRYSPDGVQQVGGPPPAAALSAELPSPVPAPPPAPPPATPEPPTPSSPPAPPAGLAGWPPPADPPADPQADPQAAPTPPDPFLDPAAPEPRSTGRAVGMAALLVVGVLLFVAIAMLTAGLF